MRVLFSTLPFAGHFHKRVKRISAEMAAMQGPDESVSAATSDSGPGCIVRADEVGSSPLQVRER